MASQKITSQKEQSQSQNVKIKRGEEQNEQIENAENVENFEEEIKSLDNYSNVNLKNKIAFGMLYWLGFGLTFVFKIIIFKFLFTKNKEVQF